jgi:hypothetical protein
MRQHQRLQLEVHLRLFNENGPSREAGAIFSQNQNIIEIKFASISNVRSYPFVVIEPSHMAKHPHKCRRWYWDTPGGKILEGVLLVCQDTAATHRSMGSKGSIEFRYKQTLSPSPSK